MYKKNTSEKSKAGLAPGTLIFTGEKKMDNIKIDVIQYSTKSYKQYDVQTVDEAVNLQKSFDGNTWINIDGLHDVGSIESLCSFFNIHKLTIEDVLSVNQRPKIEEFSDYLHIVLKMLTWDNKVDSVYSEQVSFILKEKTLLTFQEKKGDVFEGVRKRIKEGKGHIRSRGTDYLLYSLIDSVVDYYFVVLDNTGEILDEIETSLLDNPDKNILNRLHLMRKETLNLRRSVYPLREVISRLEKFENPLISADNAIFIRDLYDHTIRVIETAETFRESASGLLDLYMNSISNRMNEVMKVLTIIATIFIPLTFIAGVYGMNFEYMPELEMKYAYFSVWMVMAFIGAAMVYFFKRKNWL